MTVAGAATALPVPPSLLGESPLWHPDEAALYWCDIPGCALHRWLPASATHTSWALASEPGCIAPLPGDPPGMSEGGEVCTWTMISGCTEEGRKFAEYGACEPVLTRMSERPWRVTAR